jgi:hypothetical protein
MITSQRKKQGALIMTNWCLFEEGYRFDYEGWTVALFTQDDEEPPRAYVSQTGLNLGSFEITSRGMRIHAGAGGVLGIVTIPFPILEAILEAREMLAEARSAQNSGVAC